MKFLILSVFLFFIPFFCSADILDSFTGNAHTMYVIRLNNGDEISGNLVDINSDTTGGGSIKFKTQIGTTVIYLKEIVEVVVKDDLNRQSHRVFMMPTAEPIGKNHFLSNYMIAFFYAGFGIYDYVSVTAGRSMIPTVLSQDQVSELNVKATVYTMEWESMKGGMSIALGGNLAFINDNNKFSHLYTSITLVGDRTDITGIFYVKTGDENVYDIRFGEDNYRYQAVYMNNSFGIGVGLTTKFTERNDLYFIGEIWNTDIQKVTNTAILAGLRVQNSSFAADFGLLLFTVPAIVPVVNFTWTPF